VEASQLSFDILNNIICIDNDNYLERAKFIPLRLTFEERKFLRLLDAALNVSEYTDKIDVIIYSDKSKRIVAQIREICAYISGLVLAADYNGKYFLILSRSSAF
jgi:hypothetical protein